jgi:acyl-CoA thioesterase-1
MITAAQAQHIEVVLCAMEALPLQGWQYTIAFHQMYEDLAATYGVTLVPFLMNGVLGNSDLISDDGVHPNAAGARYIAETIYEYVFPLARTVAEQALTIPDTR